MQALIKGNLNAGLFQKVGDYTVGGYLELADHADWDILTKTNATISMWVKHNTTASVAESYLCQRQDSNNNWQFRRSAAGKLQFSITVGGSAVVCEGDSVGASLTHVAMCKVGNIYGVYVNGTQIGYLSSALSASFAAALLVGRNDNVSSLECLDGYIDDVILSHGNDFSANPNVGLTDTIVVPTTYRTVGVNTKLSINGRKSRHLGDYFVDEASGHVVYNKGVVASNAQTAFGNCMLEFHGVDTTQIDITGLDGDETTEFLVEAVTRGDTTGMNPGLRLNGDSGTNYHSNRLLIYGAGVGSLSSSPFSGGTSFPSVNLDTALTTVGYTKMILNAKSGKARTGTFQCNGFGGVGAPHIATLEGVSYSGSSKITQVNLVVIGVGKLTGGTSIKVYARRLK